MRELPRRAQRFLIACYVLGGAAWVWLSLSESGDLLRRDVLLAAMLTVAAAAAQLFSVDRVNTDYADHVTPAPLFAAVLLLPAPVLPLVVIATFLPRWVRERRRWFIHSFDIASWLTAAALARATLLATASHPRLAPGLPLPATAIGLAMVVFLGTQMLLLATTLRLSRRQSLIETGLFAPPKLLADVALLCSGWAFAAATVVDLRYAVAASVPLLVIFQALHVPSLRAQATTDPKTGLANMRHFNAALLREIERAGRTAGSAALLLCDLDYLRSINNTYGHQVGDIVLNGVADVIRRTVRARDLAGRFGGEEFVILLTDVNRAEARYAAERLRRALEQTRFHVGAGHEPVRATMSVGLAMYPVDGHTPETLLREADLALYQAKRDGRNRVVVAGRGSRELLGEWQREHLLREPHSDDVLPPRVAIAAARVAPATVELPAPTAADGATDTGDPYRGGVPRTVIGAVVGLALVTALPGLAAFRGLPGTWAGLALLAALAIAADEFALELDDGRRISVAPIAALSATLLYGAAGALAAACAAAVWECRHGGRSLRRGFLDFGATLLGLTLAGRAFATASPGSLATDHFTTVLPTAAAIGLLADGVRTVLVATARGLTEGRRPGAIWWEQYRFAWPLSALFGGFAFLLVASRLSFGWAAVATLLLPIALAHLLLARGRRRARVQANELRRVSEQLADSYDATLHALTLALDNRDAETGAHSWRVRRFTELIARHYGLDATQVEQIGRGALLHDIGTIGVPDSILRKPDRLTDEEIALVRRHPNVGFGMIAHIPFLAQAAEVVLHHHEAFDGSGYPSRLAGEQIPLGARLFAVADAFDAMTSERPYRQSLSDEAARAEIVRCRGTQFDPRVVDVFLAVPEVELRACREGAADLPAAIDDWLLAPSEPEGAAGSTGDEELRTA